MMGVRTAEQVGIESKSDCL